MAVSLPVMRLMEMEGVSSAEQQRRRWYGEAEEGRVLAGIEQVSRVTRHSAATGCHVPQAGGEGWGEPWPQRKRQDRPRVQALTGPFLTRP